MKKAKIPAKEIDIQSNNIFTNSIDQNDNTEVISVYETDKSMLDRSTEQKVRETFINPTTQADGKDTFRDYVNERFAQNDTNETKQAEDFS